MLNVTWVIDFGWRAPKARAVRVVGETGRTLRMVERRRRESREMFAVTRTLLAEARAALAASPVVARQSRRAAVPERHAAAGHAVAGWNPRHD